MKSRLDYGQVAPKAIKGLLEIENYIHHSNLEKSLFELVKTRASQINGCGYCLDMHTKDARKEGKTEQRLYALSAWRETPFFTVRERIALEWTEALTLIAGNHISDELYDKVSKEFNEQDLIALTMTIIAINGWNRLAIPFRTVAGSYNP